MDWSGVSTAPLTSIWSIQRLRSLVTEPPDASLMYSILIFAVEDKPVRVKVKSCHSPDAWTADTSTSPSKVLSAQTLIFGAPCHKSAEALMWRLKGSLTVTESPSPQIVSLSEPPERVSLPPVPTRVWPTD